MVCLASWYFKTAFIKVVGAFVVVFNFKNVFGAACWQPKPLESASL